MGPPATSIACFTPLLSPADVSPPPRSYLLQCTPSGPLPKQASLSRTPSTFATAPRRTTQRTYACPLAPLACGRSDRGRWPGCPLVLGLGGRPPCRRSPLAARACHALWRVLRRAPTGVWALACVCAARDGAHPSSNDPRARLHTNTARFVPDRLCGPDRLSAPGGGRGEKSCPDFSPSVRTVSRAVWERSLCDLRGGFVLCGCRPCGAGRGWSCVNF